MKDNLAIRENFPTNVEVVPEKLTFCKPCVTFEAIATTWESNNTGIWSTDNAVGRQLADDLIRNMRDSDAPNLLGNTIKSMIEGGVYGGAEVGFCQRIAELAFT